MKSYVGSFLIQLFATLIGVFLAAWLAFNMERGRLEQQQKLERYRTYDLIEREIRFNLEALSGEPLKLSFGNETEKTLKFEILLSFLSRDGIVGIISSGNLVNIDDELFRNTLIAVNQGIMVNNKYTESVLSFIFSADFGVVEQVGQIKELNKIKSFDLLCRNLKNNQDILMVRLKILLSKIIELKKK